MTRFSSFSCGGYLFHEQWEDILHVAPTLLKLRVNIGHNQLSYEQNRCDYGCTMQCAQFFQFFPFFSTLDCQHGNWFAYCHHHCNSVGNVIGLMLEGVDGISNVSIVVYQHLVCPKNKHGPGCELDCACTEREACHYVRGCHIGKRFFFASSLCVGIMLLICYFRLFQL